MRDGWRKTTLEAVASQYIDGFKVLPDETYKNLGVQWYAGGTFAREPKRGSEVRATRLFRVKPGQFIYNRMFVTEGSFALAASEQPFTLALPNVWHLATDVEATTSTETSVLDLIEVLHPTAAVAGTPTDAALAAISRIEPSDRGRYAGPVGWVDAHGDGEWAIALRGAQFDLAAANANGIPFTAHAGAGIVAGSDPEAELLETRVKFRPIVDALA